MGLVIILGKLTTANINHLLSKALDKRVFIENAERCQTAQINLKNEAATGQILSGIEVQQMLGVSSRTLSRYRQHGKIPYFIVGNKCYYYRKDIMDHIHKSYSRK